MGEGESLPPSLTSSSVPLQLLSRGVPNERPDSGRPFITGGNESRGPPPVHFYKIGYWIFTFIGPKIINLACSQATELPEQAAYFLGFLPNNIVVSTYLLVLSSFIWCFARGRDGKGQPENELLNLICPTSQATNNISKVDEFCQIGMDSNVGHPLLPLHFHICQLF